MSVATSQPSEHSLLFAATAEPPLHWPSAIVGLGLAVIVVVGVSWIAAARQPGPRATVEFAAVTASAPDPVPVSAPMPVPATVSAPERLVVANTGRSGVNLRVRAGDRAQRLKILPEGTALEVAGADETADGLLWRNVRDPNGTVGWVSAQFVRGAAP
jgi:hypothetical protein